MAAEDGKPAPAGDAAASKEHSSKAQGKTPANGAAAGGAATTGATAAADGEKKLSNAELKKRAKEEKAARRAQAKTVLQSAAPAGSSQQAGDNKGGAKGKPKQEGGNQQPYHVRTASRSTPAAPPVVKEVKPKVPECFSHLSMAKRVSLVNSDKDVHPVVLQLGQQMSTFALSDSITRVEATLLAFKKVRTLTSNEL
jgi:translation initiation factor eIF-2B subunit delta